MAGVWKKTLNYLGLVEEDEAFVDEMPEAEPASVRRMRPQPVADQSGGGRGGRADDRRAATGGVRALHDPSIRAEALQRGS